MVMFDDLETLFQKIRDFSEYSKALVTLTTALGALGIVFYSAKLLFATIRGKYDTITQELVVITRNTQLSFANSLIVRSVTQVSGYMS